MDALEALLDKIDPDRRLERRARRAERSGGSDGQAGDRQADSSPAAPTASEATLLTERSREEMPLPDVVGRRPRGSPQSENARAGRRIPQRVRDEVWRRDEGRCVFVGKDGNRCSAREFLHIDHVTPWALGGPSDDPRNLRILCARHNGLEARRIFGNEHMSRFRRDRERGVRDDPSG